MFQLILTKIKAIAQFYREVANITTPKPSFFSRGGFPETSIQKSDSTPCENKYLNFYIIL
ncbi:hypothetical protein [Planktothrix serta]|uniref:hypothetical protein n=1 Tax=Planktothrix serta TaxID=1678310 RepID=UPI0012DDAE6A|nr:hypothetical protein [Planktothrix serta]